MTALVQDITALVHAYLNMRKLTSNPAGLSTAEAGKRFKTYRNAGARFLHHIDAGHVEKLVNYINDDYSDTNTDDKQRWTLEDCPLGNMTQETIQAQPYEAAMRILLELADSHSGTVGKEYEKYLEELPTRPTPPTALQRSRGEIPS